MLELMFMVNGQGGYDKVAYRYDVRYNIKDGKGYSAVGPNVRIYANQLRAQAGLLQKAMASQALDFDFPRYLKDNKLSGYPERIKAEFALAAPLIGTADAPARAQTLETVRKSAFGALLQKEAATRKMVIAAAPLADVKATVATLLPVVKTLQTTMTDDAGRCSVEEVNDAVAEWESTPAAERAKPWQQERLTALRSAVDRELNTRCAAVRLPPINGMSSANRRDQTAVAKVYWPVRTAMDNFDRRWIARMREAELGFLREVEHDAQIEPSDIDRRDLGLTFSALSEWRSRQFGRETQANKGISFLPEESGPSLNLPPHIAQEFMRARTARPPASFAEQTENYFQKLYQDLKR